MQSFSVLSFNFIPYNINEFTEIIKNNIQQNKKNFIVTLNSEGIVLSKENKDFFKAVKKANYICADGMGILLAFKLFKISAPPRITGIDLLLKLCELSVKKNFKIFLFGTKENILQKAKKNLLKNFTGLQIVGTQNGYYKESDIANIITKINTANPDILFVALGMPKQEIWIANNIDFLNAKVLIGIGGSFDVISGKFKRAPVFMQKLALEWFYRLMQDPKRVIRTFNSIFKFIFLALKEKLSR